MTYKQFEAIAKEFRPDVIVSRHGDFWSGDSKYKLGVMFVNDRGEKSKVYNYSGSYRDVLSKLGIETAAKGEVEVARRELERRKEEHGKESLFFGTIIDNTKQIEFWENEIKRLENAVKIWEY